MNSIGNLLNRTCYQMADAASNLGPNGWACVGAVMVVVGWFFLKGNKVRST